MKGRAGIKARHGRDVRIIKLGILNDYDKYTKGSNVSNRQHTRTYGQYREI